MENVSDLWRPACDRVILIKILEIDEENMKPSFFHLLPQSECVSNIADALILQHSYHLVLLLQ